MGFWDDLANEARLDAAQPQTYDFDVLLTGVTDTEEVERRVKRHFRGANVQSSGTSTRISIRGSRGWSHGDEEELEEMYRGGLISRFRRMFEKW